MTLAETLWVQGWPQYSRSGKILVRKKYIGGRSVLTYVDPVAHEGRVVFEAQAMAFEWLNKFHHDTEKDPNYAEKTLAAYRLGMRGKGSIAGVVIEPAGNCCDAVRNLPAGQVYHPDQAPHLPLADCPQGRRCGCVYRPVMTYQQAGKP